MSKGRFDRLEGAVPLPAAVKKAVKSLGRFEHLEIGEAVPAPVPAPPTAAPPTGPAASPADAPAPASPHAAGAGDITLVLDGETYHSSDPKLPEDIRALFERIARHGFSQQLLAEWRSWRATRRRRSPAAPGHRAEVEFFRHGGEWILAIDGSVYRSSGRELPPEIAVLFEFVSEHGVTPSLLEFLRESGPRITLSAGDAGSPSPLPEGPLESPWEPLWQRLSRLGKLLGRRGRR